MVTHKNISALKALIIETLQRLQLALNRVSQAQYTEVNPKGNASVGQHVRHTLEFYQCLLGSTSVVDYDSRNRDIMIESSAQHAVIIIDEIICSLSRVELDADLNLLAEFPSVLAKKMEVNSSWSRELLYVLEHAIHHMALIRVLLKDTSPEFVLEDNFGVAYSTLTYRSQIANG